MEQAYVGRVRLEVAAGSGRTWLEATEIRLPMKSPVRIAVTGAGNRARKYTQYILSHPGDAILIAAADPDSRRRERFAAETSLEASRLYATDEEMLAERADEIDAVIIASPDLSITT